MNGFVTGVLEQNEVGATDGHTVYDRWLRLRLKNEVVIEIFDDQLISTDLEIDQEYSMSIVVAVPWELKYFATSPTDVNVSLMEHNDIVRGIVLDSSWQVPAQDYSRMTENFQKRVYLLLETAIGQVLMSRRTLERYAQEPIEHVETGGYLEWEPSRLDLLAIL